MALRKKSTINCEITNEFGEKILKLEEKVFHATEYQEQGDPDLMKIELDAMKEQQRRNLK